MALLKDKVALVTGAASGIGREIAILFAEEGARVVASDIDVTGGNETVSTIWKKSHEAIFIRADSSIPFDNESLVEQTVSRYGALHVACNNAGIAGPSAPVAEYPVDGWEKVIGINLSGVFYGMRFEIPAMVKSGGGSIVNVASVLGQVGLRKAPAYVAAKHGVVGLTKNAALEYAGQKIRVNAVGPGFIVTPLLTNNLSEEQLQSIARLHPVGRMGTAREVAELVLWLSSDKSSFVTGSYYPIDGGYLAQ